MPSFRPAPGSFTGCPGNPESVAIGCLTEYIIAVLFVIVNSVAVIFLHLEKDFQEMGRKPLSDERKFNRFVIMLTDAERATIEAAAVLQDQKASSWARDLILNEARKLIEGAAIAEEVATAKSTQKRNGTA